MIDCIKRLAETVFTKSGYAPGPMAIGSGFFSAANRNKLAKFDKVVYGITVTFFPSILKCTSPVCSSILNTSVTGKFLGIVRIK